MAADRQMGPANPKAAAAAFVRAMKLAKALPGIEPGAGHGTRDIRVKGKPIAGVRSDGQLLIVCADVAAKEFLIEMQPKAFWQAPHYVGTAWVIVRPDKISDADLFAALEASWRAKAPKTLAETYVSKALPKASKKAPVKKAVKSAPPKDHFARVVKLASKLPHIEVSTSYGTPSLKAKTKFLCRIKEGTDGESLVVIAGNQDEKEFLLDNEPKIFWQTPHYEGHNGLLAHLSKIDDKRLFALIEAQWKRHATKKMLAEYEARAK